MQPRTKIINKVIRPYLHGLLDTAAQHAEQLIDADRQQVAQHMTKPHLVGCLVSGIKVGAVIESIGITVSVILSSVVATN